MSLRHEQRRALIKARDLLRDCLDPQARPKTVAELRERAARALRHFPFLDERGEPLWSQDEFDSELVGNGGGEQQLSKLRRSLRGKP